jgi:hypothetical protein
MNGQELLLVAKRVCTAKQYDVLCLKETGLGWKAIGLVMGIGPDGARDHHRRAVRNVMREVDRVQAVRRDSAGPS